MEKDEQSRREEIYKQTRDDLLTRQLSNSVNLDRAILTLSSAGLGLSLTFIKNVVQIEQAVYIWLLRLSWGGFVGAIVLTLLSLIISQLAINVQLEHAREYYLNQNEEYLKKPNFRARVTEWTNYTAVAVFVIAICLLVFFITLNFNDNNPMPEESVEPSQETVSALGGAPIPKMEMVTPAGKGLGAVIPQMQQMVAPSDDGRGAPVPQMQPAPSSSPQSSQSEGSSATQESPTASSSDGK